MSAKKTGPQFRCILSMLLFDYAFWLVTSMQKDFFAFKYINLALKINIMIQNTFQFMKNGNKRIIYFSDDF